MNLTSAQLDRACGALLASAAGDALGAGYEFDPPFTGPVAMIGGGLGGFAPGEWTDDTSMAVAIAEVAATGVDLRDEAAQDAIVARWLDWADGGPKDIGVQTRLVLSATKQHEVSARTARTESAELHRRTGRTAGNGSLMRTAPVALAYLDDEDALAQAARSVGELTHFDPEAGDACVLWCTAIRHAINTGELDVRIGLPHIPVERRALWEQRIAEAEGSEPAAFAHNNGWAVAALQGAWSAITAAPAPADQPERGVFRADHLRLALEAAVHGGGDTDTVAAIAAALLGAVYGASAVPWHWRRILHGWPGLASRDLIRLATTIVRDGQPEQVGYPDTVFPAADIIVEHPHDAGLLIGGVNALPTLPGHVAAIVSMCRVPDAYLPAGVEQLDVRLIDQLDENPNLDFVLLDTVRAVEALRAEGRTVFFHCVQAHSRTPTMAALYGARRQGIGIATALTDVEGVLDDAYPNPDFQAALLRVHPVG
ncbi:ADP-ribosylglycohydrolase family protein [Mycobacterium sp. M1]|uniref:ADP-ribosylglycohydrolase family protein n=1 Tax=Mycolicibacter acidiphilus TaxID=2835306 RepID=A0ABS5RPH6_9MYCO|nr:ADP-ribosylglycohydrolase family protein [Mycolicibacter acidiphilus]MBS9535494.1 ADP-ribosylglycohydrolase family protein [Mycolicibacter acidiphilus]